MNTTPVAHVLQESSLRKSNVPPRPDRSAPPARPGRSAAAARGGPRPPRTSAATGEPPHPAAPHRREDPRPPPSVHSPRPAGVARLPRSRTTCRSVGRSPRTAQRPAARRQCRGSAAHAHCWSSWPPCPGLSATPVGAAGLIYPRRRTAPQHYGGARWPSRSDASAATARDREASVRCRRANRRADSPPQAGPHRVSARPVLRATQPLPRGCGPPPVWLPLGAPEEITDVIEPLLPVRLVPTGSGGRPQVDERVGCRAPCPHPHRLPLAGLTATARTLLRANRLGSGSAPGGRPAGTIDYTNSRSSAGSTSTRNGR